MRHLLASRGSCSLNGLRNTARRQHDASPGHLVGLTSANMQAVSSCFSRTAVESKGINFCGDYSRTCWHVPTKPEGDVKLSIEADVSNLSRSTIHSTPVCRGWIKFTSWVGEDVLPLASSLLKFNPWKMIRNLFSTMLLRRKTAPSSINHLRVACTAKLS